MWCAILRPHQFWKTDAIHTQVHQHSAKQPGTLLLIIFVHPQTLLSVVNQGCRHLPLLQYWHSVLLGIYQDFRLWKHQALAFLQIGLCKCIGLSDPDLNTLTHILVEKLWLWSKSWSLECLANRLALSFSTCFFMSCGCANRPDTPTISSPDTSECAAVKTSNAHHCHRRGSPLLSQCWSLRI